MSGKNFTNFIQTCDNDSSSSDNESGENVSASDEELFADLIERNAGINQRLKDSQSTIRAELDDGSLFNNSSDYTFSGFEGFSVNDTDKKKAKHLTNATNMPSKRGRFRAKPEHRPVDLYDSSDDTSSRGTLDSIIPPPKDFRGRNNPFINDDDSRPQTSTPKNGTSVISALFGNGSAAFRPDNGMRMVRTVKRRLSAKDIRIGPNMEVKRRKLKRRSDLVEVSILLFFATTESAMIQVLMQFMQYFRSSAQLPWKIYLNKTLTYRYAATQNISQQFVPHSTQGFLDQTKHQYHTKMA